MHTNGEVFNLQFKWNTEAQEKQSLDQNILIDVVVVMNKLDKFMQQN